MSLSCRSPGVSFLYSIVGRLRDWDESERSESWYESDTSPILFSALATSRRLSISRLPIMLKLARRQGERHAVSPTRVGGSTGESMMRFAILSTMERRPLSVQQVVENRYTNVA